MQLTNAEITDEGERLGLYDTKGEFEARIRTTRGIWRSPLVEIVADNTGERYIAFGVPEDYEKLPIARWGWERVSPPATLMREFARVKRDDQALAFARQYGPLWICSKHTDFAQGVLCCWKDAPKVMGLECHWETGESLDAWLRCARQVRAALRLTTLLRSEHSTVDFDAWCDLLLVDLHKDKVSDLIERYLLILAFDKNPLAGILLTQTISEGGGAEPWGARLILNDKFEAEIVLGLGFLPPVWLAVATAATSSHSVQTCSNCNKPYKRPSGSRLAKTGQRNYCPDCGKNVDYAPAKRQSTKNKREHLREFADFLLESEIGDLEELRQNWNGTHPLARFDTVDSLETAIDRLLHNSYSVPSQREKKRLREKLDRLPNASRISRGEKNL